MINMKTFIIYKNKWNNKCILIKKFKTAKEVKFKKLHFFLVSYSKNLKRTLINKINTQKIN